jgi:hypothetical protein
MVDTNAGSDGGSGTVTSAARGDAFFTASVAARRIPGRVVLTPLAVRIVVEPSGFFICSWVRNARDGWMWVVVVFTRERVALLADTHPNSA